MVWLLWAEQRVHGDVDALQTPTGWIPRYEDLVPLFRNKLGFATPKGLQQFTIRVTNFWPNTTMLKIYRKGFRYAAAGVADLQAV